jgi:hypothetical protein
MGSAAIVKTLDRVAQHRSGHGVRVMIEKMLESLLISLADFPQHPPGRLVQQIVRIREQEPRDTERWLIYVLSYPRMGRHHGDPSFPPPSRARKAVKNGKLTDVDQPGAENFRCGNIHKIPVVNPLRVSEVESRDLRAFGLIRLFERPRQNEECERTFLMNPGSKQGPDRIAGERPKLAGNPVKVRGGHSKPDVLARGIVGASFEKTEIAGAWPVARGLSERLADTTRRRRLYRRVCLHLRFSPVTLRNRPYA